MSNNTMVYNPISIVKSITDNDYDHFWARTWNYENLKKYIMMDFDGLKEDVNRLIKGEKVKVDTNSFQNDMYDVHSKDEVFTVLIHLGCLTYNPENKTVSISNKDVLSSYFYSIR